MVAIVHVINKNLLSLCTGQIEKTSLLYSLRCKQNRSSSRWTRNIVCARTDSLSLASRIVSPSVVSMIKGLPAPINHEWDHTIALWEFWNVKVSIDQAADLNGDKELVYMVTMMSIQCRTVCHVKPVNCSDNSLPYILICILELARLFGFIVNSYIYYTCNSGFTSYYALPHVKFDFVKYCHLL